MLRKLSRSHRACPVECHRDFDIPRGIKVTFPASTKFVIIDGCDVVTNCTIAFCEDNDLGGNHKTNVITSSSFVFKDRKDSLSFFSKNIECRLKEQDVLNGYCEIEGK